jgi:hypothetical protein
MLCGKVERRNAMSFLRGLSKRKVVFVLGVSSQNQAIKALSSLSFYERVGDEPWPSGIKSEIFMDKGGTGALIILQGTFSKAQQDEVKNLGKYESPRLRNFVTKVVAEGTMGALKSGRGGIIHVLTKKGS